jgi:antitoxin component HigA of HigAB toxin-antitoxin module
VDPKVKREFISIIREFFGDRDFGETYQDFANVIVKELTERFAAPLEEINKKRREQKSYEFPYPGEREINALSMGINQILQIRDPEQMVKAFINTEDDLESWLESIEKLNGFYNKTPITIFDDTVDVLDRLQKDLTIIQDNDVLLIKKQITDILTNPNPYRDIPKLPQLTSQLESKINEIVNEQRQAINIQVEKLEKKLNETKEYYLEIPAIVDYIDTEMQKFNRLKSNLEHEKSLVIIRVLLQDLTELTNKVENQAKQLEVEYRKPTIDNPSDKPTTVIREKQSKKLNANELYRLFFNGRKKIETQQDLDHALQELRKALLRELKDYTLEIE